MQTPKIKKLKLKQGDHFTVLGLLRNGTLLNDGSFVGDTYLCLSNSGGVVECSEYNKYTKKYEPFNSWRFIHGVNCILQKIKAPVSEKRKNYLYQRAKTFGAYYHEVLDVKLQ